MTRYLTLMSMYMLMILATNSATWAQDKPNPPIGMPPQSMLAKATEKEGSIIVSLTSPILKPRTQTLEAEVDGKKVAFTRVEYDFIKWYEPEFKFDGKILRAFGIDGKEVAAKELPERLKKNDRVTVFLLDPENKAKLDEYYLKPLREDTVVFTIPATNFYASQK